MASTTTGIGGQTCCEVEAEGNVEFVGDTCNTTTSTTTTNGKNKKRMTTKTKPSLAPPFKPSLDEVAIFLKDKELFSFRNIIITPFDHNILYSDVKTKLKGLDMGGEDRMVIARHLSVQMLRKIATAIGLSSHNLTRPVVANISHSEESDQRGEEAEA